MLSVYLFISSFSVVHRKRTFLPTAFPLLRCDRQRQTVNHFVLLLPGENSPKFLRSCRRNMFFHLGEGGEGDPHGRRAMEMSPPRRGQSWQAAPRGQGWAHTEITDLKPAG